MLDEQFWECLRRDGIIQLIHKQVVSEVGHNSPRILKTTHFSFIL